MAASLIGIMALVWVNMTSNTTPSHKGESVSHNRQAEASATAAPRRISRTRSPLWSLIQPQI